MRFSVIYSFDCPGDFSVKRYYPSQRKLWTMTERSDTPSDAEIESMPKHRKLCAILTRKQFDRFLSDTGLFAEDIETMGSIGAPGFGVGWAPAISFRSDDCDAYQNAYVTPLPETSRGGDYTERDWERIRSAVIRKYGL